MGDELKTGGQIIQEGQDALNDRKISISATPKIGHKDNPICELMEQSLLNSSDGLYVRFGVNDLGATVGYIGNAEGQEVVFLSNTAEYRVAA